MLLYHFHTGKQDKSKVGFDIRVFTTSLRTYVSTVACLNCILNWYVFCKNIFENNLKKKPIGTKKSASYTPSLRLSIGIKNMFDQKCHTSVFLCAAALLT